jgi:release factor glutamine methyltransferase
LSTIQELTKEARSFLEDCPDVSVESKVLLLKSLSISEEVFYSHPGRRVTESEKRRFYELVHKRRQGIPLAYVVGEKEFWSLPFKVSPGVLIPRSETELLVEKIVELSGRTEEVIIDIGTGCGNIAVCLARELPEARIIATDISAEALKTARWNASRCEAARITFFKGDLFSALTGQNLEGRCDFVVSNPPYVSEDEWKTLQSDIRLHEPKEALVPGKTGLEIVERIASDASKFLKPGGYLCLEIGFGQLNDVLKLFGKEWEAVDHFKDLNGIPRLITAKLGTGYVFT